MPWRSPGPRRLQDDRRPGSTTQALGLNDRGEIVGTYADFDARRACGLLRSNGVCIPIDAPGALATNAYDINARGPIVGIYLDADETIRGFAS